MRKYQLFRHHEISNIMASLIKTKSIMIYLEVASHVEHALLGDGVVTEVQRDHFKGPDQFLKR